jgi:hypothetical protein
MPFPCRDPAILRTRAGRQHAVSGRPILIHTMPLPCRAVPWPWEVAFRTAYSWHGRGTARQVWIKHDRTVEIKWETHNLNLSGTAWYVWISLNLTIYSLTDGSPASSTPPTIQHRTTECGSGTGQPWYILVQALRLETSVPEESRYASQCKSKALPPAWKRDDIP